MGVKRASNEVMVAQPEGIACVRSVRRVVERDRWGDDNINWVQWAPWNKYRDDPAEDGEVPEGVPAEEAVRMDQGGAKTVYIATKAKEPRELYISRKDVE